MNLFEALLHALPNTPSVIVVCSAADLGIQWEDMGASFVHREPGMNLVEIGERRIHFVTEQKLLTLYEDIID